MRLFVSRRIGGYRFGASYGPRDFQRARTFRAAEPTLSRDFVYVVQGHGAVKIGVTRDLTGRLSTLQTGSAHPLTMAYSTRVCGDAYAVEAEAHSMLARHRIGGEWFAVPADVAVAAINGASYRIGSMTLQPQQKRRSKLVRWVIFGLLAAIITVLYTAYREDEMNLREHPELVNIDPRTGAKNIDLTKALRILAGFPVCPSQSEVDALQSGANSNCKPAPTDIPVDELEMFGFLSPSYRVRPKIGKATDLYVPLKSLANEPPQ